MARRPPAAGGVSVKNYNLCSKTPVRGVFGGLQYEENQECGVGLCEHSFFVHGCCRNETVVDQRGLITAAFL